MDDEQVQIRRGTTQDAAGIAHVHVDSWRDTYARLLPAGTLDDLDVASRARRWEEILAGDGTDMWVACRGSDVVGFAGTSDSVGDDRPRDLQLESIYVLASELGVGTGQALLDSALGDRPAFLWVAEDNPRAHAFYRRNGFVAEEGTRPHSLAGHEIRIVRFIR